MYEFNNTTSFLLDTQPFKKRKAERQSDHKKRNRLGKKNKNILLNYFKETNKSPGKIEICLLARNTGLSEKKIKYWFDQKRTAN